MVKRKPTAWQNHLIETYRDMKKKDDSIKLSDAMTAAKKTYKK